jgi:hypothetical protein
MHMELTKHRGGTVLPPLSITGEPPIKSTLLLTPVNAVFIAMRIGRLRQVVAAHLRGGTPTLASETLAVHNYGGLHQAQTTVGDARTPPCRCIDRGLQRTTASRILHSDGVSAAMSNTSATMS